MAKRKKQAALAIPSEVTEIALMQRSEGIRRAFLEREEELSIHEGARHDLHYLKANAVATLEKAMLNTGVCGSCGASGLVVDKTAVDAAKAVLDRSGLPPAKEVITDKRKTNESVDIIRSAVDGLVGLDPEEIAAIVALVVHQRPDSEAFIRRALDEAPLLVDAESTSTVESEPSGGTHPSLADP